MNLTKKVAVIDDDEVFQLIIQKQIEIKNLDCQIIKFYNGQEAIDFLIENSNSPEELPNIILLDVNMPIKDGWEFLEEYKTLSPQVKKLITLYMVTSSVIQSDIDKAKQDKNIREFVSKPITNQRLEDLLG